jgi:hypothetical protein
VPIQFPVQQRHFDLFDLAVPWNMANFVANVDTTNLGDVELPFESQDSFAPGPPGDFLWNTRVNLRNLGADYEDVTAGSRINPAVQGPVSPLPPAVIGVNPTASTFSYDYVRQQISGVTRDSTGAPLGSVEVKVIRTEDTLLIGKVISDPGTGAWTLQLWAGGPFFLVEYLTGSPDRAGTSVRTLVANSY